MRATLRRVLVLAVVATAAAGCTTTTPGPDPTVTAGPTASGPVPTPRPVPTGEDAGLSQPKVDPIYPDYGHADIDVLSYRLVLSWAPTTRVLTGEATLRVRATTDLTRLALDFVDSYTVDSVTVDGTTATPGRAGLDLVVPLAHPLARDARTTVVVRYHGVPHAIAFPSLRADAAEGLGLRPMANGEAWTMQEPYGASTWYPANDHPSDEATYDITVTVPTGWSAIASGTPGPVTSSAAGTTFRYTSADPVASYVVTLALGRYTRLTATGPAGLPLTYWLRTGRDEALAPAARTMPDLLTWLTDHFGPYPFPSAGVVFVDSQSAMETQQMVTYGGEPSPDVDEIPEILLHELSHQWFGDAVTPTDWLGLWLNEGWAMYAEWLWSVDQHRRTDAAWVSYAEQADQRSRAQAGPPGHPRVGHFAENNVYLGPALMLREIRLAVGDAAFFSLARDWVQTQRGQSVDRAGFTAFVNRHTGRDLTALIDRWLDSPTTPTASPQ